MLGSNGSHQCSLISSDDEDVKFPYFLSKTKEIGISETSVIEHIRAMNNGTIVFVRFHPFIT